MTNNLVVLNNTTCLNIDTLSLCDNIGRGQYLGLEEFTKVLRGRTYHMGGNSDVHMKITDDGLVLISYLISDKIYITGFTGIVFDGYRVPFYSNSVRNIGLFKYNPVEGTYNRWLMYSFSYENPDILYGVELSTKPEFKEKNWWIKDDLINKPSIRKMLALGYLGNRMLSILDNSYTRIGDNNIGIKVNTDLTVEYNTSNVEDKRNSHQFWGYILSKLKGLHILSDNLMVFICNNESSIISAIWFKGYVYTMKNDIPIIDKYVYSKNRIKFIHLYRFKESKYTTALFERPTLIPKGFKVTKEEFLRDTIINLQFTDTSPLFFSLRFSDNNQISTSEETPDFEDLLSYDNTLLNGQEWSDSFITNEYLHNGDICLDLRFNREDLNSTVLCISEIVNNRR